MSIRYRTDIKKGDTIDADQVVAVVMEVHENGDILVEKNIGQRRNITLRKQTWQYSWDPVYKKQAKDTDVSAPVTRQLTEDDVRRIVREELASRASKVESALRSFLDELFDAA